MARDFSAFRKKGSMASHTNIFIHSAKVTNDGEFIAVDITASWFVYGMMRFIAYALIQVGLRKWSVENFREIVESADASGIHSSAPACGLCLIRVGYGAEDPFRSCALPAHVCLPTSSSYAFEE